VDARKKPYEKKEKIEQINERGKRKTGYSKKGLGGDSKQETTEAVRAIVVYGAIAFPKALGGRDSTGEFNERNGVMLAKMAGSKKKKTGHSLRQGGKTVTGSHAISILPGRTRKRPRCKLGAFTP